MSANDLDLKYTLDVTGVVQPLTTVNKTLDANAQKATHVSEAYNGLATSGELVQKITKQIISEYETLVTTTKRVGDEIVTTERRFIDGIGKERAAAAERKSYENAHLASFKTNKKEEAAAAKVAASARIRYENEYLASYKASKKAEVAAAKAATAERRTYENGFLASFKASKKAEVAAEKASRVQRKAIQDKYLSDLKARKAREVTEEKKVQATLTAILKKSAARRIAASRQAEAATKKVTSAVKAQNGAMQTVLISWKSFARLVAVQLVHRAISGIVRATREAVSEAIELQKRIAEIQTISQDQPQDFADWAEGIRDVSSAFGFGILDTAEAAYQTLSNQVAKGAQTFTFLAEAAQFATVTNSSLTDSVNVLSSAINSYDLSSYQAELTAAKLFKTIELGRVRASEIASTLGRVTVVGSQLGITLDEINALLAQTSVRGLNARQSLTQIRGVMNGLLKPTKAMADFFAELGVESGQAAIAAFGLDGVFQRLADRTEGQAAAVAKLIPRVRGLSAALAAISDGGSEYIKTLEKIQEANDSYEKAVVVTTTNAGKNIEKSLETLKNVFVKDLGIPLTNAIAGAVEDIDVLKGSFKGLINAAKTGSAIFNAFRNAVTSYSIWGESLKGYQLLLANITAEERAEAKLATFRRKAIESYNRRVQEVADTTNKELLKTQQIVLTGTANTIVGLQDEIKGYDAAIANATKGLGDIFDDLEKSVVANLRTITSALKDAEKLVEKIKADSSAFVTSIQKDIFNEQISRQSANQQVITIAAEIKKIQIARRKAIQAGNQGLANDLIKEQQSLLKQLISVDSDRVDVLKANTDKVKALEAERVAAQLKGLKGKDLEKFNAEQKAKAKELAEERLKVESASTGKYFENYRELYSRLIVEAEEQEKKLLEYQLAKIKTIEKAQKQAALEVALFKIELQAAEDFDINKVLKAKPEDVEASLKARQEQLGRLAIIAKGIADKEAKKQALEFINIIKTSEQKKVQAEISKRQLHEEERNFKEVVKQQQAINLLIADQKTKKAELLIGQQKAEEAFIKQDVLAKQYDKLMENINTIKKAQLEADRAMLVLEKQRNTLLDDREAALKRIRLLRDDAPGSVGKADGGMIQRFATGGRAHGSDSVNAQLTPGEFVMNASSTRKFYSQLVGMNSGNNAIRRADGGGTSIGDININMSSSGNEGYDVQRMGRSLKREIRRGTLAL